MRHTLKWLVAAAALAACDGPTGTPGERPGVRFISGHALTDTINAPATDLVVQVYDAEGRAARGKVVTFAVHEGDRERVWVGGAGSPGPSLAAFDTTDQQGLASARVALGARPGPARVVVTVAELGYQDTTVFTVQPGAPAAFRLEPRDTALYAGSSYALSAVALDRRGNTRADAVTLSAGTPKATVDAGTVRAVSVGRAYVVASVGARQDTAWVSVVPPGVLAAWRARYFLADGTVVPGATVVMNTDGSQLRELRAGTGADAPPLAGPAPAWSPDGREIAFVTEEGRLLATDLAGGVRVVWDGDRRMHPDWPPLYSPDGQWIYYARGAEGSQATFWRARADGSQVVQVSPRVDWGLEKAPSPAPDGRRVVYQTNRATNSPVDFTLRVLDVVTGSVAALDVPGGTPRWSPGGDWIAYTRPGKLLWRMRPDGTGSQRIGDGVAAFQVFSWSPDGEWLAIAREQPRAGEPFRNGLFLVNPSTGEVLPLAFRREYTNPAWRP